MLLTEHCDVLYVSELNCVFVKWKKYCSLEDYRTPLRHAIDIMAQHENCHYIADTRDGFECCDEDTQWVNETFAQAAFNSGCRHIFFIKNKVSKLDNELDNQSALLSRLFEVHYCESFDDVKLILLSRI